MGGTADEIRCKRVSEVRWISVDMTAELDAGEVLTGTPALTVVGDGLTADSPAVNSTELTINDVVVPIGRAVRFRVSAGVPSVEYGIKIRCDSDASQDIISAILLQVIAD